MLGESEKKVVFAYSVQGASHIKAEKKAKDSGMLRKHPCQDRSFYREFEKSSLDEKKDILLYVKNSDSEDCWVKLPVELKKHSIPFECLCVSDGHGSPSYFRSDRGAELAIQSYVELLSERIEKLAECYKNKEFETIEKGFSVGIARDRWTKKVVEDLIAKPITKEELEILKETEAETAKLYREEYDAFCSIENDDERIKFIRSSLLKEIYGCTFIAYIQTKYFWYAMQIGTADFAISYNGLTFEKPIAEDPNCFANFTTSLCGKESYKDFRFAHGDVIPKYVFCSSDGISNSVQGDEGLFDFYKWAVNEFTSLEFEGTEASKELDNKIKKVRQAIANNMPSQSERGSGDDFSLATILNLKNSDFINYRKTLSNNLIEGAVPIAKKTLVVFFLIDASENMVGEKIEVINNAIPEIISIIKDVADDNADTELKIATLRFGGDASWKTPFPVDLKEYKYKTISASGKAVMGKAFFELASKLDKKAFLSSQVGSYPPIIILLSDGKPCDDYKQGLNALKQNKYFAQCIRVAFEIGKDANIEALAEFTETPELVLKIENKNVLKRVNGIFFPVS